MTYNTASEKQERELAKLTEEEFAKTVKKLRAIKMSPDEDETGRLLSEKDKVADIFRYERDRTAGNRYEIVVFPGKKEAASAKQYIDDTPLDEIRYLTGLSQDQVGKALLEDGLLEQDTALVSGTEHSQEYVNKLMRALTGTDAEKGGLKPMSLTREDKEKILFSYEASYNLQTGRMNIPLTRRG